MDRINSYEDLENDIVSWLKDYYWMHNVGPLGVIHEYL